MVKGDDSSAKSVNANGHLRALTKLSKKAPSEEGTLTRKEFSFEDVGQKIQVSEPVNSNQDAEEDKPIMMDDNTVQRMQAFYKQRVNSLRRNGQKFYPSQAFGLGQSDDGKLWPSPPYDNSLETIHEKPKNLNNLNSLPIHLSFGENGDAAVPIGKVKSRTDSANLSREEMTPSTLEDVMYDGLTSVQGGSSLAGGSQGAFRAGGGFGRMKIQGKTTGRNQATTAKRGGPSFSRN